MSRELERELDELLDELSSLRNHDDMTEGHKGMIGACEATIQKMLSQIQNARHLNGWYEKRAR